MAGQAVPGTADLIATLQPAVVNISVVVYERTPRVAGNMASQPTVERHIAHSSGFFIAPSGILVTNRHAIAGASEIIVTLHDTTRLSACVVATAAQSDIAVLKVNPAGPVATVKFGDSDAIRPGDPVFVIGNPLGHGSSVSAGIVSALDRNSVQSEFGSFFQFDAALNVGNSGGPVFNGDGAVVGVATALFTAGDGGSVGLGLAIPGNDAQFIVDRLLQHGQVQLGWIGAHIQPVTADIAAAVKLPAAIGSIVTGVADDSPATRAGVTAGDVILKVGDADADDPRILNQKIAGSTIGSTIRLVIWRDGTQVTVPVVVAELPADKGAKPTASANCEAVHIARRDLGLSLAPITADARETLGLTSRETGVLVADVAADSVAADHGIAAGSVIVNVERKSVSSPAEVQADIDAARAEKRGFVMILVRNAFGVHWTALPLDAG
jgi:serine protease Do